MLTGGFDSLRCLQHNTNDKMRQHTAFWTTVSENIFLKKVEPGTEVAEHNSILQSASIS